MLSERQMARISPHFPLSHGVPRVDHRRVVSGIVYVIKNGLQWKDAPKGYGPHKTLYNRFLRWSRIGVFDRIFAALAGEGSQPERIMIDSTHLKAHRTAASLLKKGDVPRPIGRTKGGLNSKLHAVCDGEGQPLILLLSEGQMSDHKGARLMVDALPTAFSLLGDKGYDSNWFRKALADKGIEPCIPPTKSLKQPIDYDKLASATRSKTCSASSRTGGPSLPATIAVPTPSSRQSASPLPSSSGFDH